MKDKNVIFNHVYEDSILNLFIVFFLSIYRNGSGSREVTTIKPPFNGRNDVSSSGQERAPVPPTMNDKYFDLMAILLGHIEKETPMNYDKVIIKNDITDDLNPSMGEMLEVKMG